MKKGANYPYSKNQLLAVYKPIKLIVSNSLPTLPYLKTKENKN